MNQVRNHARLSFDTTFTLTEVEIRALDALVGYGDDAFIKHFKENLGAAYLEQHEAGLRSFFGSVREQVLPALRDIQQARRDLQEAHRKRIEVRQ